MLAFISGLLLGLLIGSAIALFPEQTLALLRNARDAVARLFHREPKG